MVDFENDLTAHFDADKALPDLGSKAAGVVNTDRLKRGKHFRTAREDDEAGRRAE